MAGEVRAMEECLIKFSDNEFDDEEEPEEEPPENNGSGSDDEW